MFENKCFKLELDLYEMVHESLFFKIMEVVKEYTYGEYT